MSERSAILSLPFIQPAQAQKHVTHNAALCTLDVLVQMSVLSSGQTTPPADPTLGDSYIVPSSASGEWAGQDTTIATAVEGGWNFLTPKLGWQGYVQDLGQLYVFGPTGWTSALGSLNNLPLLGIGTLADISNPFSAKMNRALWTAVDQGEGGTGDLVQVLNKETNTNDTGFTFQTAYSTQAIFGTFGSNDIRLATTADGTTFKDVFRADVASGTMVQPNLPKFRAFTNFDNLGPDSTWVKIAINQTDFNDQGVFDPVTSLFTAPMDGTYALGGFLTFKRDITGDVRMRGRMVLNGSTEIPGSSNELVTQPANNASGVGITTFVELAAGDTVELQGYYRLGSGFFKADETVFWGYKVG